MNDDLPGRLRVTAEEFRPDSERMWERVASGMDRSGTVASEPARRGFRIPHLAIATGVAVVLIAAVVAVGYGPGLVRPTTPAPGSTGSDSETGAPAVGHDRPEAVDDLDFLSAGAAVNDDTDNAYWSQAELTLDTEEPLTELTVELYVVVGEDVETTGSWTTAEHYFGMPDVYEDDGYLVYRWTLREDETVEPGEYVLAGQHNHGDGARDTGGDYYVFEASADSGEGTVIGHFPPQD
ncbi:hypothetical protein L0U85_01650 [Glycomyces sp. L485]|uniref:hypothetical protein n=1 Tax=Glycomyces sp. L485 TaxID=2909235 RepID=UPI001F4A7A0E|nr:hypothetical protein [Glycomyces sp. L485]MCH7229572.1 hypothetical protein [Glycomyces sp. L485]